MEQLESSVRCLWNAVQGQQAIASVELLVWHSSLLKYIGERPIGVTINEANVVQYCFDNKGGSERAVRRQPGKAVPLGIV